MQEAAAADTADPPYGSDQANRGRTIAHVAAPSGGPDDDEDDDQDESAGFSPASGRGCQ